MGGIAHVRLVESWHYRPDAFCSGLHQCGYSVVSRPQEHPGPGDLLVLWNRYDRDEAIARRYEAAGADVFITENAWLGPEDKYTHWFALARNHHNGAGQWYIGDEPKRSTLVECKPWRTTGNKVVVLPQRGMGEAGVRQVRGWTPRLNTRRPVEIRKHPGIRPHPEIDWSDVWACATWASGAGIKAIVAGVPVFYAFPKWIGAAGARFGFDDLENPFLGDRSRMLHNLSWAMWTAEEIASGEPFRWNIGLGSNRWCPPVSQVQGQGESRALAS